MCVPLRWAVFLGFGQLLLITATASRVPQLQQQQLHAPHGKSVAADGFESWGWPRTATVSTPRPWTWQGARANSSSSMMQQPPAVRRRSSIQYPRGHFSGLQKTASRRLQHAEHADDGNSDVLEQWLQNSTWTRQYAGGSCFPSGRVERAADMTDFLRLVQDPTVNQIQLVGDIIFTSQLFPPEYENAMDKGTNVSHVVEIRACTSREAPIIVDVNNVFRQVYVNNGRMTWQGTIKFINSFPSMRRGGLWVLVSVLSIEEAGRIYMQGVHIHGPDPSALFTEEDPFWEVHNNSRYAPQPHHLTCINSSALLVDGWLFNRTAWLLHSQGANGVIRSTGDGYWFFTDTLVTYTASSTGAQKASLTPLQLRLAIALPVVCGVLLLLAGSLAAWWFCKRKRRRKCSLSKLCVQGKGAEPSAGAGSIPTSRSGSSLGNSSSAADSGSLPLTASASAYSTTAKQRIEATRQAMRQNPSLPEGSLVLQGVLGEGTFGKVYTAMWKGSLVAVKTMLLPAAMSGKERREKMAIMETAISASLSHPNIVQTYTYEVKALTGAELMRKESMRDGGTVSTNSLDSFNTGCTSPMDNQGWEVRLVLELCDMGTLQDLLARGGFRSPSGHYNMAGLVATAADVARAMLHLHTEHIIHGDLKARNVLLKSAPTAGPAGSDGKVAARGFVAKVSDFGLSNTIDPTETHISNLYQGTLTHMAPEVLIRGKLSFASDVYAFGIMMYEMYTASQAFPGIAKIMLGHEVVMSGRRPEFPPDCPFDYQLLACRCWESDPAIRPTFEQILSHLQQMSKRLAPACSAEPARMFATDTHALQDRQGSPAPTAKPPEAALATATAVVGASAAVMALQPHAAAADDTEAFRPAATPAQLPQQAQQVSAYPAGMQRCSCKHGVPSQDCQQQRQQQQLTPCQQQHADVHAAHNDVQQGSTEVLANGHVAGAAGGAVVGVSSAAAPAGPEEPAPTAAAAAGHALPGCVGPDTSRCMCMQAAQGVALGQGLGNGPASGQQLQRNISLGTWDGGGLWLSGSPAPLEVDGTPASDPPQQQQQGLEFGAGSPLLQPQFTQHHFLPEHLQQQQYHQMPPPQQQQQQQQAFHTMLDVYAATRGAEDAVGQTRELGDPQGQQQQQSLQSVPSLGTWSGGGLWMSGSYTPLEEVAGGPAYTAAPQT